MHCAFKGVATVLVVACKSHSERRQTNAASLVNVHVALEDARVHARSGLVA